MTQKRSKLCKTCGKEFQVISSRKYCSDKCYIASHTKTFTCKFCGNDFKRYAHGKTTYEICGASCRGKYARSLNNPMDNQTNRDKMSQTLREIGHKPIKQGGNGRGFTTQQSILLEKLGEGWEGEHIQNLPGLRKLGYPTHYKLDIANERVRIAIEIDGASHSSAKVRERDIRKDHKLRELGWTVFRFKNKEIDNDLDRVVRLICNSMQ